MTWSDITQHARTLLGIAILIFGIPITLLTLASCALLWLAWGWAGVVEYLPVVAGIDAVAATALYFLHRAPPRAPGVPGPAVTLPFVGNVHLYIANRDRQPDWFYEMALKHGNFERAWSWCIPRAQGISCGKVIMLCTPENVKHVLKTNFANYVKGAMFKETNHEFIGQGIFSSDGEAWRMHRKIASHMFTRRLLTEGTKIAVHESRRLVRRLRAAAAAGEEVDMQNLFFKFTMDVFCNIAFGIELKSLERAADDPHPFAAAFDGAQAHSMERFGRVGWRLERNLWFLFARERRFRRHIATMNAFAFRVIRAKRRGGRDQLGPDLLSRFLEKGASFKGPSGGGAGFTDKELRDLVVNFLLAGRDTTACALSWTLYELQRNPAVRARVREEADSVFGADADADADGGAGGETPAYDGLGEGRYTFDAVKRLAYTHAVVTETLRLHPSVPIDIKWSVGADVLPDGTPVAPDTVVSYVPFALGRSPKLFAPDPLAFRPARWLPGGGGGGAAEPGMFDTAVFNAGARLCLGKSLAYLEVKLLTAVLAQRFDFACTRPMSAAYRSSLVMPMKHGLNVTVQPRA